MLQRRRGYYSAYSTTVGRSRTSDTRPGAPSWFLPVSARRPRLPPRQRQVNGGGRTRAYITILLSCVPSDLWTRFFSSSSATITICLLYEILYHYCTTAIFPSFRPVFSIRTTRYKYYHDTLSPFPRHFPLRRRHARLVRIPTTYNMYIPCIIFFIVPIIWDRLPVEIFRVIFFST